MSSKHAIDRIVIRAVPTDDPHLLTSLVVLEGDIALFGLPNAMVEDLEPGQRVTLTLSEPPF